MQITVADALVRIKTTKARIETARTSAQFIVINQAGRIANFRDVTAFNAAARSSLDSITALLRNYAALKSAIIQSNAVTPVTIGKETMTVAAAIERKKSIEQEQAILAVVVQQYTQARRSVDQIQTQVQQQAEQQAIAAFGNKPDRTNPEFVQFIEGYTRRNGAVLVDPLGVDTLIARWGENIQNFLANVDLALTTSNVMTLIEVDLT